MALNKRRLDRSQRTSKGGGGGQFWRPDDGRNIVRLFTFSHEVTKADFKKGIYRESDQVDVGDTYDELERCVWRHFVDDGVVNCLGKGKCEYCDEAKALMDSKSKSDQKAGKQLSGRKAFYVNLVDMNDVDTGMQMGALPSTVFNAILQHVLDPEFGEGILGSDGRDFIIDRDKDKPPSEMYNVRLRDESKSKSLAKKLADDTTDLFDCDLLEPGVGGSGSSDKSDDDEDEKPKSRKSKKDDDEDEPPKKSRNSKKDEDENDYEDDAESDDGDGNKPPWEKDGEDEEEDAPVIKKGVTVSFEDAGENVVATVVKVNKKDGEAEVKDGDGDVYDIPLDELSVIKKKSRKRG